MGRVDLTLVVESVWSVDGRRKKMTYNEAEFVKDLAKSNNEVLEKLGWKWSPKFGEYVIWLNQIWIVVKRMQNTLHLIRDDNEGGGALENCIPILHWEEIQRILEDIGYIITAEWDKGLGYYSRIYTEREACGDPDEKSFILEAVGKDYQEAIMRGVIELRKQIEVS